MKIGFIGAGFVARALAQGFQTAGHEVMLSNSRGPKSLYSTAAMIGCQAGTVEQAAAFGDVLVLAVPFDAVTDLASDLAAGKTLIDACNYHPLRDDPIAALDQRQTTTTQIVADHFPDATVVKAFNAVLATDLDDLARTGPTSPRRALPIAGEDDAAKQTVAGLHDQLGLDALDTGGLAESWRFERDKPAYCHRLTTPQLLERLAAAERDVELPSGNWDA